MKQETLEEAAENYANYNEQINKAVQEALNLGYKIGQERMYSEEDMNDYANYRLLIKKALSPKEWFEEFKKK
jgi:flagellar biosynthesis/type III secretory pathway protein FliH